MAVFQYKIGNLYIKINSCLDLSVLSLYKPFVSDFVPPKYDISIDICQIRIEEIEEAYNKLSGNWNDKCTYAWVSKKDRHYMIFSKRSQRLCTAALTDIWILDCNEGYSQCILYVPFCASFAEAIHELSTRPWLQRLFLAYSCQANFVLCHGALVDIDGEGVIFLGDSGSGKSTLCDLLNTAKVTVIADDRFILDIAAGGAVGFGTPWNIKNPQYCKNSCSEIKKVFILSHGNNQLKDVGNNYHDMVYGVFPAMLFPSFMSLNKAVAKKIRYLNFIRTRCGIYSFAFKPDVSAISYIMEARGRG